MLTKASATIKKELGQYAGLRKFSFLFRHRGLKEFFESGTTKGIQANHVKRLRLILSRLNAATSPRDMNLPGLFLHELVGQRQGHWSVRVSGNWRLTFRFDGVDAYDVNLEDYH